MYLTKVYLQSAHIRLTFYTTLKMQMQTEFHGPMESDMMAVYP